MYLFVWLAVGLAVLVTIPVLDTVVGNFIWRPVDARTVVYPADGKIISVVFPGFSNPLESFGEGMAELLRPWGPVVCVGYDTDVTDDLVYEAVNARLAELTNDGEEYRLLYYGHSMGGEVADRCLARYEQEGSPYGKALALLLDCSPAGASTLKSPLPARQLFRIWRNGPLLTLIVAALNLASRRQMPVRLDASVDEQLYRRYTRELMLFNRRAWCGQARYMLDWLPTARYTSTRVYYVGAKYPARDILVDQAKALNLWLEAYHDDVIHVMDTRIVHAWPIEQPMAYREVLRFILTCSGSGTCNCAG